MVRTLACIVCIITAVPAAAAPGKLILHSGHVIEGDVARRPDGGYWLTMKTGAVRFEQEEVKKAILYSKRDPVQENFISSFRITPAPETAVRNTVTPYDDLIHREARQNNLDPALVKAVIKAESNFNPLDVSPKGACGLMQLMPGTARLLGVKSIFAPEENIQAGTRFLKDMLHLFDGDVEKALAAYNAGPGAVKKYRSVPPYRETRNYIRNVQRYYRSYRNPERITVYTDESGCLNFYNER